MAVRVLRADRIYFSPGCQFYDLREGDVVDGDLGVWLLANYANGVEEIEAAPKPLVLVGESGPVLHVRSEDGQLTPAPEVPVASPKPDPDPDPLVSSGPSADSADDDPAPFEPADHTGPDVIAFAKAHPEQREAILAAERAGKARTTVLGALSS